MIVAKVEEIAWFEAIWEIIESIFMEYISTEPEEHTFKKTKISLACKLVIISEMIDEEKLTIIL